MRKTLVKGSKAAKDFMAKLRAKKGAVKKTIKRVAKNAKQSFKDGYYAKDKVGAAKLSEKELIMIASDYAYATGGNLDRAIWNLTDPDYTKKLLPVYKKAIKDWEKKYKTPIRAVGSTLLINKGENPRAKPTRVIQVDRTKKGAFKKFKRISGVKKHTDTKSHNVNISVVSGVVNIMDVKRDLDKSILLLEGAKMATIDKNNTNYLTQNKPLVFKNITEKKSFIKQYTKQVKILKDLYRNTLKNKLNK